MPQLTIPTPGSFIMKDQPFGWTIYEERLFGFGYADPLASVYNYSSHSHANAVLFTAAPDLLAGCDAAMKVLKALTDQQKLEFIKERKQIEKAILIASL